ncbi:MAG: hypothetical protein ACK5LJ_03335 [Paracoccus sp. (in: a-proteobacteria)]
MRLPLSVEEITREWIESALAGRYPDIRVKRCDIADVMLGTSTKVRIRLTYDPVGPSYGLPDTMIVKGGFEEHSPSMKFMYAKEARTYREVLPLWGINAPACFFAESDEHSHQSIILMEDLYNRGVTFCHALEPQGYEQLRRRLRAMAHYHAQMWEHPAFADGGSLAWIEPRMTGDTLIYADRYLQPDVWLSYLNSPRGAAISRRLHDLEWMRAAFGKLAELHRLYPQTLSHGDTHLGNLYEESDGAPGFFDMQVNRAPWFADVTYHLICALDLMDRRDWERPLLQYYLDCLEAEGIPAPGYEEAWDCYRKEIAWGLFVFMINETRFQTEAVNTAYCARFADAALCHDTLSLLA